MKHASAQTDTGNMQAVISTVTNGFAQRIPNFRFSVSDQEIL